MLNLLNVWFKIVRKKITYKYLSIMFMVFLLSLITTYLLTDRNIFLSIIIIYVFISAILFGRLFIFHKRLLESNTHDLIKLKPIHPLLGLLIYNQNPLDIFIIFPILIYIQIKNYIVINQKR